MSRQRSGMQAIGSTAASVAAAIAAALVDYVRGPASATDNAVARYDATTGKLVQDSLVTIGDTGNVSLPALATVDGRDVSVDGAALDALGTAVSDKVTGPASATDNAVTRYDSTTGKLVQDSLVTISDTGNISLPALATVDGRDVSVDGATLDALAAASGDVDGPASATDNAIVRFDGTTGKLVQDSGVTVSDTGNITVPASRGLTSAGTSTSVSAPDNLGGTGAFVGLTAGAGSAVANDGYVGILRNSQNRSTPLRFQCDDGSVVIVKAPTAATNHSYTLPTAQGSANQQLTNNGSGTLSWATCIASPGTVTDNAIVRYDATTGRLVQNSGATVEDDGRIVAPVTRNAQSGATYTFVLTDQGKVVSGSNAGATTFTVPPNSSVAYPTDTTIHVLQLGAGTITIAQGAGVTIRPPPGGSLVSPGQYWMGTLYKIATDEWILS